MIREDGSGPADERPGMWFEKQLSWLVDKQGPQQLTLNPCSPDGGDVWGGCGTFRKRGFAGGSSC